MTKIITIDFETYFDDQFTLKKLTTEEYIRDERFEAHGAAVFNGKRSEWLLPEHLKELCEMMRADQRKGIKIAMLAHHAHFDGLILSHHFDFCPDIWMCTLSMARVCFDSGVKLGLADLAARLGLAPKSVPYDAFKGRHWHELDQATQNAVAAGAMHDCALTHAACNMMLAGGTAAVPYAFPASELPVVSAKVKMFTEPVLVGDVELLGDAWYAERDALVEAVNSAQNVTVANYTEAVAMLRNDIMFAALLRDLGVDVDGEGRKITTKGNEKYAFAKSDQFMQELATDFDEQIAEVAQARLKAQSSIYLTRVERFGNMATRGPLPIYLAYAAAHTRRWGGGDKANWQNLPRPDPYKPAKGALRRAIKVP